MRPCGCFQDEQISPTPPVPAGERLPAPDPIGISFAVQIDTMGRTRRGAGVRVMGPSGVGLLTADPDSSSRLEPPEQFLARPSPRLPRHDGVVAPAAFGAVSLLLNAVAALALVALVAASRARGRDVANQAAQLRAETPRLVFLIQPPQRDPGGGGGGGGNRKRGPIPRAQAPGRDSRTLPAAKPIVPTTQPHDEPTPPQAVALEAKPLASALAFQVGALHGPPALGPSQGLGSGGGVGTGVGTGVGSGRGPGVGPGSGGGTGGGVYRPGNGISPPILLREAKPTYTAEALRMRIQGSVLLELIVQRDGTPRDVRVIRGIDPFGLDREAVFAAEQWRFGPGRLNGEPVDVLVTIVMDFRIH